MRLRQNIYIFFFNLIIIFTILECIRLSRPKVPSDILRNVCHFFVSYFYAPRRISKLIIAAIFFVVDLPSTLSFFIVSGPLTNNSSEVSQKVHHANVLIATRSWFRVRLLFIVQLLFPLNCCKRPGQRLRSELHAFCYHSLAMYVR